MILASPNKVGLKLLTRDLSSVLFKRDENTLFSIFEGFEINPDVR